VKAAIADTMVLFAAAFWVASVVFVPSALDGRRATKALVEYMDCMRTERANASKCAVTLGMQSAGMSRWLDVPMLPPITVEDLRQ